MLLAMLLLDMLLLDMLLLDTLLLDTLLLDTLPLATFPLATFPLATLPLDTLLLAPCCTPRRASGPHLIYKRRLSRESETPLKRTFNLASPHIYIEARGIKPKTNKTHLLGFYKDWLIQSSCAL